MARRKYTSGAFQYTISPDIDLSVGQRTWAIVTAQLTDELTGREPNGAVRLSCSDPHFSPRVASGGNAGLAGIPSQVVPLLRTKSYPLSISMTADSYVSDSVFVTIPANPSFPDNFTPFDIPGLWELHRRPVSICGRVTLRQSPVNVAVPFATVSLTKMWRAMPDPVAAPPPDAAEPLTLSPVMYATRAAAVAQVRAMPVTGGPYRLVREGQPGNTTVLLDSSTGLNPTDVLALDRADPENAEYITVTGISGALTSTELAIAELQYPLLKLHRSLLFADKVTPQLAGPPNALAVGAIAGDTVVLAQTPVTGVATGDVLEITGGAAAEYHVVSRFSVLSNAAGFFRLPLLSRAAQIELMAGDGVHLPVAQLVIPDYSKEENRVDFLLR